MTFCALIVAAGSGQRAGEGPAKQWRALAGQPVLAWSARTLIAAGADPLVVVIRPGDDDLAKAALSGLTGWRLVYGGASRTESVRLGLNALPSDAPNAVLIHDAARPFVTQAHISALLAALKGADGAVPALAVADSLKRDGADGLISVPRDGLFQVQTPQAFDRRRLVAAYAALPASAEVTDDAGVMEQFGGKVARVPGDPRLFKLTYPEDFAMAEAVAQGQRAVRTGLGYDAHRFGPGDKVWLCGLAIDHDYSLIGHSDADVALHALTDALLGAIGAGDIGDHFPPSDPQWRGAASSVFLRHAADLVTARGGQIVNIDLTLICEQPKIKPHRRAMRENLAALLNLPLDRVSLKATTTEGMGFTGRGEGMAAQAVANVDMPLIMGA
jgi:2-C-methyl-D-erythritol 4-phosphate cytidylyltransferase/2-C-methyl-D-erythritol 2,4-cyclodiphosphate synthase